ncbi:Hsp20/alpha crystallin family protein [Clostridium sp.]|uniref:Hsp20/alpha crystallin family protein n=1 Tax=Clostridium sp. TaxID=1506 RepID=UPI0026387927|nr:Hsp20/alpha crystallin family protein [Clostridium sp.]
MGDFLTSFDDDFFGGWFGKPMHLVFNTNRTKDMMPSYWQKTEEGYKVTCRTVGISAKDVKVALEENHIHVEGKSTFDNDEYSTSYDLPIVEDVRNNIKGIRYRTQDGITIIYLDIDRPKRKLINIEQIK